MLDMKCSHFHIGSNARIVHKRQREIVHLIASWRCTVAMGNILTNDVERNTTAGIRCKFYACMRVRELTIFSRIDTICSRLHMKYVVFGDPFLLFLTEKLCVAFNVCSVGIHPEKINAIFTQ